MNLSSMELYLFLFFGLIARFPGIAGQGKSYIAESSNVFTTAFLKYNKYFRPYNESAFPVLVNVRMDFVKVLSVDVDAPSMTSIVDIRLKWVDGRLYWYSDIIKHVTVNSSEVWTPDVYFLNMETKPETLIDPRFLTIESTGKVFWFQRIRLLTPCTTEPDSPGNLACPVTFGSMQFPKSELDFDQIECGYSISTINGRFNVTSVEKQEVIEELPGVPFLDHTITRGSCTAFLSVDMEPTTKQQENNCQNPASTASLKSSSGSVIASLGVTFLVTLTSMVTINER